MGYHADGSFTFTFRDEAGILAAAAEYENDEPEDGIVRTPDEARSVLAEAASSIAEYGEVSWSESGTGLTLSGWASNKFYSDRWEGLLAALAKHAEGHGDFDGEDDSHWRNRLFGDGTQKEYEGKVYFPDDPLDG